MAPESVDICLHAGIRRVVGIEQRFGIALKFHCHAQTQRFLTGVVKSRVGDRLVEEMVGLIVCEIEAQFFPTVVATRLVVWNPNEFKTFGVDSRRDVLHQIFGVADVFIDPIKSRQLNILVAGGVEASHQLVDKPDSCG